MTDTATVTNNTQPVATDNVRQTDISPLTLLEFDPAASLIESDDSDVADILDLAIDTSSDNLTDEEAILQDNLVLIDSPLLSLFNEDDTQNEERDLLNDAIDNTNNNNDLTAEQIQEFGVLQEDIQALEAAADLDIPPAPLNNNVTVDLSEEAQRELAEQQAINIRDELISNDELEDRPINITDEQIRELAPIIAPYANEPLDENTITRIQEDIDASDVLNFTLTPQNLFIVMAYAASMQPATANNRFLDNNESRPDGTTVTPVKPVSPVNPV